jgi:hypothetical protein
MASIGTLFAFDGRTLGGRGRCLAGRVECAEGTRQAVRIAGLVLVALGLLLGLCALWVQLARALPLAELLHHPRALRAMILAGAGLGLLLMGRRRPPSRNGVAPASAMLLAMALCLGAGGRDAMAAPRARPRFVQQISASSFADVSTTLTDETDSEAEPHVAVDPADPSIVVAVVIQGRPPYSAIGYATSHDGGRTWSGGSLPGLTAATGGVFESAQDPVVAIGPDGTVYALTLELDGPAGARTRSSVVVQRSEDGGLTFDSPILVQDSLGAPLLVSDDKPWIAVDGFPASPHYGRVYVAWTRVTTLDLHRGVLVSMITLFHGAVSGLSDVDGERDGERMHESVAIRTRVQCEMRTVWKQMEQPLWDSALI